MRLPVVTVLWCVAALLGVAVAAAAAVRRQWATALTYGLCFGIAAAACCTALLHLLTGAVQDSTLVLPLGLRWIGTHFRIDALAASFLFVINFGGAMASLYAIGYGRHESASHRVIVFFPLFLAGMNLVVLADDAFTFLLSWEFMSLSSWALVMAHHEVDANRRAGYIYLVMASFGTLALLLAFGLLAGPDGGYAFATMRAAEHTPLVGGLVLVLLLLGAGSKAGLAPLHVWLPLAHPAAPSHISALMSGVMTKVAVYGFVRIVFDLLGDTPAWMGFVVLLIGGGTTVLGILHALMESDLKRLLAYSTIENIGIIFVGLGLALAFRSNGMGPAAALAMTAALLHVFNHSLFKSLLFFGAGAVLNATGSRDMEKLGGLIHRMPYTSFAVLVGCMAISALPPLNGFVSEWLTFQAILRSPELPQWGLKILVPAIGGLLALGAALAAACFVKLYGVTFLGRARSPEAEQAREVDRFSLAAMLVLAAVCLAVGILPGFAIDTVAEVTLAMVGDRMPEQASIPWLSIVPISDRLSSYNGLLVFVFSALSALMAAALVHRFASKALRRGPIWACGFAELTPAMQYSGHGFAQPIRRVFGTLLFRAREHVEMPAPGELRPARFAVDLRDVVWDIVYAPISGSINYAAGRLNRLQFLTIRRYLTLVFVTLVLLLLALAIWS